MHKRQYPAIRLKRLEGSKFRDEIPTVGINPAHPLQIYRVVIPPSSYLNSMSSDLKIPLIQGYATTINIHRAGRNDITVPPPERKKPISEGCLLIRRSQWNEFSRVVNMVYGIEKVKVLVRTTANIEMSLSSLVLTEMQK